MFKRVIIGILTLLSFTANANKDFSQLQIDSLEKITINSRKDSVSMQNLLILSEFYFNKNLSKSRLYASKSYQTSKELKSIKGKAFALLQLARVERKGGQLSTAVNHIKQSEKYFVQLNNQKAIGEIKSELGNLYAAMGNMVNAIKSYQDAIDIFESVNYELGIAICLSDLGNTHFLQKNYNTALRYFKKSKLIFEQEQDLKAVSELYNRISNVYREMNELDKSLDYNYYALMIQEKLRDKAGIANSNMNIAKTYIQKQNLKRATGYIDYAIKLFDEINDQLGLTKSILISAEIEILKEEINLAEIDLQKCIEIANDAGAIHELSQAYKLLSNVYQKKKNYKEAYLLLSKHTALKDTLYSFEQTKLFSEMEVKYRTKSKEKELQEEIIKGEQKSGQFFTYIIFSILFAIAFILIIVLMLKKNNVRKEANIDLEKKNELIKQKNQQIIDSILYAKKIQQAILTPEAYLNKMFSDYFLLFRPKDIVSGDFYWAYQDPASNKSFWVTADCTGHGVPGALMSVIGTIMLNEIVIVGKNYNPKIVLSKLSKYLKKYINNNSDFSRDGIELSFCVLDRNNNHFSFCGANGLGFILKNNKEIIDIKGSKQPIGFDPLEREVSEFKMIEMDLEPGDLIITCTDGFPDQLEEKTRKKYKIGKLKQDIKDWHNLSSEEIKENLKTNITKWQGDLDQIDDMLVIGVKI